MNYLAHLSLSQQNSLSIIGNLMGDFRRYLPQQALPEPILRGINNHRLVDKFTDSHPLVHDLRGLFNPKRRRFADIILDITFDYFLIRHWEQYSRQSLDVFIDHNYECIQAKWEYMPVQMQRAMTHMIQNDLLRSYRKLSGIGYALDKMSERIRFKNHLLGSI